MNKSVIRFFKFVIIIGVIIAIAIPVAKKGFEMLDEKKYADIETDLLLIQAKVKVIKGKSDVNSNTDAYVGEKVSESNNDKVKETLKKIQISEDYFDKYFILNSVDFEKLGIQNELKNKEDSVFVVNYDETEVIYTKGIKVDGIVKYKLSEIVKGVEKKEWILHNRMIE